MRIDYRRTTGFAVSLSLLALIFSLPAAAQNRVIKGKVTNDKGEPVVGAAVLIQGTDVKREYKVNTDKKGEYFYMGIPFGVYRIVVRAPGYQPDYADNVKPSIAQESDIPFTLKPGEDHKLAFELSPQEMEKLKQEAAKAKEQKETGGEIKAMFDAGLALAQQGKYADAVVEFKKALEKDPLQPYILANMGDALSRLNQMPEALDAYQKAIAAKPDDAAMYTNMGVLLGKMGKMAESQEAFKKAASINPAAAPQNFFNLGATLVNSGRPAEAAEAFKQAIAADPNYAEAYYQLGICQIGNPATIPEALKALEKYTEIGKNPEQVESAKQLILALGKEKGDKGKTKKP